MALTQISTQGIKDGTITGTDLATNIDLVDNQKIRFGNGDDLQIFHNGTDSIIDDTGTGKLVLRGSTKVEIRSSGNEDMAVFTENGAVELYHDNIKKFETTSTGVTVAGNVVATGNMQINDNAFLNVGNSGDLQIYHNGSQDRIDSSSSFLILEASNHIFRNNGGTEDYAKFLGNGAVELYHNNSKKFETTSTGVKIKNTITLEEASGSESYQLSVNSFGGLDINNDTTKIAEFTDASTFNLLDNIKLTCGAGADLQIFHNGQHSFIQHTQGSGNFFIDSAANLALRTATNETSINCGSNGAVELYHDGSKKFETTSSGAKLTGALEGDSDLILRPAAGNNNVIMQPNSGAETLFKATVNGAVELYHDNSKKLETRSDGLQVDGTVRLPADNSKLLLGANLDLQIYHDGSFNFIRSENGHPINLIKSNTENIAKFIPDGGVELYYDNSKKFETISTGIQMSGDIKIQDNHRIKIGADADLEIFYDSSANSKIQSNGSLTIKHQNGDKFIHCSSNSAVELYHDGTKKLNTHPNGIFTAGIFPFADNTHSIGSGSERFNTVFATQGINTSDKNEKNTIVECDLGLSFINKLKPVSYKWNKSDGKTHYGLIAQDIEETIKSVGKNLSDFGGIYKEENESMGLAYNEIFSPLIKAVQELSAKVAALEAS